MVAPQCASNLGPLLLAHSFGGVGLDCSDQPRQRHLGRVVDEQVKVVDLAIGFHQRHLMALTHLPGGLDQEFPHSVSDRTLAVLGHQHDVRMQTKDHMPA